MSVERFAVLVSGRGSNLKAILDYWSSSREQPPVSQSEPVLVLSNRPEAPALEFARAAGVPAAIVDHTAYADRRAFEDAMIQVLEDHRVSWIVLAGFMRVLTERFIQRFQGRILNTHPALLPCFPGRDGVGQALSAGVKISGCTVHLVGIDVDTGTIIAQEAVPVLPDDDHERLDARIRSAEHHLYPRVIARMLAGQPGPTAGDGT